jgi:phage terminase large subunit
VVKCGIKDGALYLDEMVYQNNLISTTRRDAMKAAGVIRSARIIADRNPEAIEELRRLYYPYIEAADKGPGSIKAGIDLMKGFEICVTERSKNLISEMNNYEWEANKRTGEITGDPIDAFNHAIDAARYWVQKTVSAPVAQKRRIRSTDMSA